jgi:phage N-6-adenine-methyltransferase
MGNRVETAEGAGEMGGAVAADKMAVHYSSKTEIWETPQDLFDRLHAVHGFTLDVCALPENAKCPRFFTPEMDGLSLLWGDNVCWMNPPYGREIGKWVKKAYEATLSDWQHSGAKVVCLLPARTDTAWWHDYVIPHGKVEFLRGRLKFSGNKWNAPFPNAIVVFERNRP